MITEKHFADTSTLIGCEVAVIKAVTEVESRGTGFLNGLPKILFEPHIFWRQLKAKGIDPAPLAYTMVQRKNNRTGKVENIKVPHPKYGLILYPKWGERAYGPESSQHKRLELASEIDRDAALESASWGLFQIMGFNWEACGCASLQEFVNRMYKDEAEHLKLFAAFLRTNRWDVFLKAKQWEEFARRYNGPGYAKNAYHLKLQYAYNKHKN